jgi:hypothetical protein
VALSLASLGISQLMLFGYRHLYAELIAPPLHGHPAYLYAGGLFLLSDFAPIVRPADYPIISQRAAIFNDKKAPLWNPRARDDQRWSSYGICSRIMKLTGDEYRAEAIARKTALRAVKHHPFAVLQLAGVTFADYFDRSYFRSTILTDEGSDRRLETPLIAEYKRNFNEDFATRSDSLAMKWHRRIYVWYWIVLVFPFPFCAYLISHWRTSPPSAWLCACFLLAFLEGATVTVTRPTARFLTTMAWLSILAAGWMISHYRATRTAASQRSS